ncbi:MAG TPA: NAD(P)H-binding protein [Candidatus Dormibacteraeota bacterium]|nr:NAD(P)H-binding protein [Candidatus Dormibacteraeota bacterium]
MRIAITGGTGFVGRHLAQALTLSGHEVVLVARGKDKGSEALHLPGASFLPSDLSDVHQLARAFSGGGAVAHCAGINRELGEQTYDRVHVAGTRNVVEAARRAGVGKIVLLSFLRARPDCGSAYHQSKWAAEEIVRASGLDFTILKAGVIYGRGDHVLDHLSQALRTFPLFALVGMREKHIRRLAVEDLVRILRVALLEDRMSRQTLAVTGPDQLLLGDAVRRVADVVARRPIIFPMPVFFHRVLAFVAERIMTIPLMAVAQLRILSEGIVEPLPFCDPVPDDLSPRSKFTSDKIRRGLPDHGPFGCKDLRGCA